MWTSINQAFGQAEVEPWGNITGIGKNGQLFDFESSIVVVKGLYVVSTAKERQQPKYKRSGDEQIITTNMDSLFIKEIVKDLSPGEINVTITLNAHAALVNNGIYFCVTVPDEGRIRLPGASNAYKNFIDARSNFEGLINGVNGAEFKTAKRDIALTFENAETVRIGKDTANGKNDLKFYIALKLNGLSKGDTVRKSFTIKANGDIDTSPVHLVLNTLTPGREFDGLGGNFRLQNAKNDPKVIDYCLQNLRVAFGRVELPWRFWQPNKDIDPTRVADSGKMYPGVTKAMLMAQRLNSMGVPLILSAWFPPDWAVDGKVNFRPVNGIWGNPLNKDNMQAIYKSIADYILYLKSKYGTEVKYFSFNESDLGINIRLTPQDHDDFIKGCGAFFAAHGLITKMLLGDNSDATTYTFIDPALNDPGAKPYIGAISFHSWRGWDTDILQHWADAATKLGVPLIVGEGSIDAAAWKYPDIFQEQTYALKEINLYTRLLAICQPQSILQWQLTADYSPLIGGGIFGNNEPLHPGQRFWNLKQLSITPKGLYAMPISCDKAGISCAALGDNLTSVYAIHLVNNGTERSVTLTGLPAGVKQLKVYTTTKELNMEVGDPINVKAGIAKFKIRATSYVTLISQ